MSDFLMMFLVLLAFAGAVGFVFACEDLTAPQE